MLLFYWNVIDFVPGLITQWHLRWKLKFQWKCIYAIKLLTLVGFEIFTGSYLVSESSICCNFVNVLFLYGQWFVWEVSKQDKNFANTTFITVFTLFLWKENWKILRRNDIYICADQLLSREEIASWRWKSAVVTRLG